MVNLLKYEVLDKIKEMKRSKATWKRFYELFPRYKENYAELNNKNGIKLKKIW